jgi:hypothetical protein
MLPGQFTQAQTGHAYDQADVGTGTTPPPDAEAGTLGLPSLKDTKQRGEGELDVIEKGAPGGEHSTQNHGDSSIRGKSQRWTPVLLRGEGRAKVCDGD